MAEVRDTVFGLWQALSARDWDLVKTYLADDCIYVDMPVGLALAARGPDDIVKRLKVGLEPLAGYQNHTGLLVVDGADAIYEHSEKWTWVSGETALLPFVTVHRVAGGKITVWKDYWNFGTLVDSAPTDWLAGLADADTSWVFDATDVLQGP